MKELLLISIIILYVTPMILGVFRISFKEEKTAINYWNMICFFSIIIALICYRL